MAGPNQISAAVPQQLLKSNFVRSHLIPKQDFKYNHRLDEGKQFIETYFGKYPGIRDYIDSTKSKVRTTGYVETLIGRRRYIPEISSNSFQVRSAGERMAINMPVQGTAADIIKIAMVRIQERMDANKLDALMIIQVHDELIFEAPSEEMEELEAIVLEVMPSAMELTVPLDVDLKTGLNWGDMA